jgi:L-2-hydroxyglutarate oxidase LhgO
MATAQRADVVVVGAGIVGLATAYRIQQALPALRVVVLEKEAEPGQHQTGHNSGVIHSGIYYRPGSLKAENCQAGRLALIDFCEREGVPYEVCGKVIVAVGEEELPALARIEERGLANGVRLSRIGPERLAELEPEARGVAALHVPDAGIVDFVEVSRKLAAHVKRRGDVRYSARVVGFAGRGRELIVETTAGAVHTRFVVTCAGLQSDRVSDWTGDPPGPRIIPFRGEYYQLTPLARRLVKNLIYPVPDPAFPFLGVHFTRMIDGGFECGPNAVPALGREAYGKLEICPDDVLEALAFPGFWRLARKHYRTGLGEIWRSFSKAAFVRALQRLVPAIEAKHLEPAPAGIRAQALTERGELVDDFSVTETPFAINVRNAPSPAATSSLNIGRLVAERVARRFA